MELNDIWAWVGDRQVFQGLNLTSVNRKIGLIGRNGAGKSTLLRILQGLIVPEKGLVQVERPVGLVFQNPDHQILFPTVLEELVFGLTERGYRPEQAKARASEFLEQHGAEHLLELATHELSVGQKALVCILAVLIDEPRTLLIDEAFGSLDLVTAQRMTLLVQRCSARVVFATHQTHLLESFDEVIWLDQGFIRMQGPPGYVLTSYKRWGFECSAEYESSGELSV